MILNTSDKSFVSCCDSILIRRFNTSLQMKFVVFLESYLLIVISAYAIDIIIVIENGETYDRYF